MKKHIVSVFVLTIGIVLCSGCTELLFDSSTRYQSQATTIHYTIRYGYNITVSGEGSHTILYRCDKPAVLQGTVSSVSLLYSLDYQETMLGENQQVAWNISKNTPGSYQLGILATVQAQSVLVSDLNGEHALSLDEIATRHSDLVHQYCRDQTLDNKRYIDPTHPGITATASNILSQTQSENAFVLAQALFVWVKENTNYQLHGSETAVQPASVTYQLRTGDCDDLSFLYISLCRSLGIPARFIRGVLLVETNGIAQVTPHAWSEVFVGGNLGNDGWVPVECAGSASIQTELHQNFGVEDCHHLRQFIDEGSNQSLNLSLSSISWTYTPPVEITAQAFFDITSYTVVESKQLVVTEENTRSFV